MRCIGIAIVVMVSLSALCACNTLSTSNDGGSDAGADVIVDDALVKSDAPPCVFGQSHFGDGCTFGP